MNKAETKAAVLVVDDELPLRDVLSEALQNDGYIVSVAANGREALELIKQRSFDLMFLDIKMPKVTGEDVLARAKKSNPSMPVVVLSAVTDSVTEDQMRQLGAVEYLKKPCSLNEVVETANRVLGAG
ncbi:MAG: response regulator [Dehalococcoidia bacterium]